MRERLGARRRLHGMAISADFARLWAGQAASVFGSYIGRFALSMVAVVVLNATPAELTLLRVAEVLPVLLLGFHAGVLVDRWPRRPVMMYADLGRALVLAAVPVLALLGVLSLWWLLGVAALVAALGLGFDTAFRAYLPTLVSRRRLVASNSRLEATNSLAEVAGFGLAGAVVQALTAPLAVACDSLSFLISAGTLARIRHREDPPAGPTRVSGGLAEIGAGLQWVLRVRSLRALAGIELTQQVLSIGPIATLIMIFYARDAALDAVTMGVLFALGGASALIGAWLTPRLVGWCGPRRAMAGGYVIGSLAMVLVPLAGGSWELALAMFAGQQLLGDGAMMAYEITRASAIQQLTPDSVLGRVSACLRVIGQAGFLVGAGLGWVLADLVGVRGALLAAAGGGTLGALWLLGWRADEPAPRPL